MINNRKSTISKTSKGYRLRDSTHRMIEKIQVIVNGSKDAVITKAMILYYSQLNGKEKLSDPRDAKFKNHSKLILKPNQKTK